jgi:hypothetical protein
MEGPPNRTVEDPSVDIVKKKMEHIKLSKLCAGVVCTTIGSVWVGAGGRKLPGL